jgi:hypothetical protein
MIVNLKLGIINSSEHASSELRAVSSLVYLSMASHLISGKVEEITAIRRYAQKHIKQRLKFICEVRNSFISLYNITKQP